MYFVREAFSPETVPDDALVIWKMGIVERTFYRWKKKFIGMGVAEVRRLKNDKIRETA
jgi:hypothetical protein